MKKVLILIAILINPVIGFNQIESIGNKSLYQLNSIQYSSKNDTVINKSSKLSFGYMPIVSGFYKNTRTKGMGLGIELNLNYQFNDNYSLKSFVRYSNIINALILNGCGSEGSLCEESIEDFLAGGLIFEYKFFKWFGLNTILGLEIADVPREMGYIYGGGINFYFPSSKWQKSITFAVYHSNNQSKAEWLPYSGSGSYWQGRVFFDAVVYQLGCKTQFYKKKN